MSEPLNSVQETLVFVYAFFNLPIGDLTKHTYYRNGGLLFPGESRRAANYKFQNHKRAIKKSWKSAEKNIKSLDIVDFTALLKPFDNNIYIETLAKTVEDYMMSRHTTTATSTKKYLSPQKQQAGGAAKHGYYEEDVEDDDRNDDASYVDQSFHNDDESPLICGGNWSPTRNTVTTMVGYQHQKPFQLVESADSDANIMSLIVMVGNGKRLSDNGKFYYKYMRITKLLNSSADYDKTDLKLVPGQPHLLEFTYPAVSKALTNDFKKFECQIEVDVREANENNQCFITNLQDRMIGHETLLAKGDNVTKTRLVMLPIDPATLKHYACHNNDWQGVTHDDTDIVTGSLYKYKIMIPITTDEIEGGCIDEGLQVRSGQCGWRIYAGWYIPISGQEGRKLAQKTKVKRQIKLKTKEEQAADMLANMNITSG